MRVIRDDLHWTGRARHRRRPRSPGSRCDARCRRGSGGLVLSLHQRPDPDALLALLADCAMRAERLRRCGAEVVMLTGSEICLFALGFLPGDTLTRAAVGDLRSRPPETTGRGHPGADAVFLRRAVTVVRERFGGPVSYASLPSKASTGRRSISSPPTRPTAPSQPLTRTMLTTKPVPVLSPNRPGTSL